MTSLGLDDQGRFQVCWRSKKRESKGPWRPNTRRKNTKAAARPKREYCLEEQVMKDRIRMAGDLLKALALAGTGYVPKQLHKERVDL